MLNNLFDIVGDDFFKPLVSKYKRIYIDCINLIYNTYNNELSFGVDKDVVLSELEYYFDQNSSDEMLFEDNEDIAKDARAKAAAILRRLKDSGWIYYEEAKDSRFKVVLADHATILIEAFSKITKQEDSEYQTRVSTINSLLSNKENYAKPYELMIKGVIENTDNLTSELKRLNSSIKKRIEFITVDKTAFEINRDFFDYLAPTSNPYHRFKTDQNISRFRVSIKDNLRALLGDENNFNRAVDGYMEIEGVVDRAQAKDDLSYKINRVITTFLNYDDISHEIDNRHSKYLSNAVARADFLLTSVDNEKGKISEILIFIANALNAGENPMTNDAIEGMLHNMINIFPQRYISNDSLSVIKKSRKISKPADIDSGLVVSEDDIERILQEHRVQEKARFSEKNIKGYVNDLLINQPSALISTTPLKTKRDMMRISSINYYATREDSEFKITYKTGDPIVQDNFKYKDFVIERK